MRMGLSVTDSRCKGCGRRIVWARDPEGKAIPLDASAPVYIVEETATKNIVQRRDCRRAGPLFLVSHFSTCHKASEFSGSRRKEEGA
jgi:hypothetical protein